MSFISVQKHTSNMPIGVQIPSCEEQAEETCCIIVESSALDVTAKPDPVVVAKMSPALLHVYLGALILLPVSPVSTLPVPSVFCTIEAFSGLCQELKMCFEVLNKNLQVPTIPTLKLVRYMYHVLKLGVLSPFSLIKMIPKQTCLFATFSETFPH